MRQVFKKLFVTFVIASFVVVSVGMMVEINSISTDIRRLQDKVNLIDSASQVAYEDAIEDAMKRRVDGGAPEEKSIYQLRGDAQTEAQRLLDRLTTIYELPQYRLAGIRYRGALGHGAAGTATDCEDAHGVYTISLNEILFIRNYRVFMDLILPHEIAHVVVCMLGGFEEKAHGEEWQRVMTKIGFRNPQQNITHNLDMYPVYRYQEDLASRLDIVLEDNSNEISN